MSYSSYWSTTLSSLISISLIVQSTIANIDDNSQLYHICSNSQNFTIGSSYQDNLTKLLSILNYKTPPSGFSQASTGQGHDRAYGLALCRGDVFSTQCRTCVANASAELVKLCPNDKGAIIWYDFCMLKYTDKEFLGTIDNQNKFYMYNVVSISKNPNLFNKKVSELLNKLSKEASSSSKLYGVGEKKLDTFTKLYGLAQCSRDLSKEECKTCLDGAIIELPNCCYAKQGGRVVGGTCNVRYEIYPFTN